MIAAADRDHPNVKFRKSEREVYDVYSKKMDRGFERRPVAYKLYFDGRAALVKTNDRGQFNL